MRRLLTAAVAAAATLVLAGCDSQPSTADREATTNLGAYDQLQANQPAAGMSYSPARNTLNRWAEQWSEPGKLSYVYLLAQGTGQPIGYYVLEGIPVSYCTSLTPTEQLHRFGAEGAGVTRLPGIDGTYYSGSGCDQYFGLEAGTGTILEFGAGVSYLLSERPLQLDAAPLATTTVESAG
ncbi:hypothetical protein [Pseudonocardia sp. NPDC049635]|uniref:hypothetical protein n=1 Tax=Pseudonocardia sp. NPDC049635 TaxID=3155506 RepID=UPI0033E725D7